MFSKGFIVAAGLACGLATSASAVPVEWVVDYTGSSGSSFDNGVLTTYLDFTITGAFTYDADTGTVSDVALSLLPHPSRTTPVSASVPFYQSSIPAILNGALAQSDRDLIFAESTPLTADLTGLHVLTLSVSNGPLSIHDELNNAGGERRVGITPILCLNSGCSNFIQFSNSSPFATPNITGTPVVPQVPLPASMPLMLAGLGGLAWWRRRKS